MMAPDATRADPSEDRNLRHLLAELERIDVLVGRAVYCWQLAGQDPNDAFRGLRTTDAEARLLLQRPFAAGWGHAAELPLEDAQAFGAAESAARERVDAAMLAATAAGALTRLMYLSQICELDRFDLDAFLICLAPALDLRYERLYAYLQDDVTRKRPSPGLILDLLCPPGADRLPALLRFAEDAPLFKYGLLSWPRETEERAVLARPLAVDPTAVAWLLGSYQPGPELSGRADLAWPDDQDKGDGLLAGELLPALERLAAASQALACLCGPDAESRDAAARRFARAAGYPLLRVDVAAARADAEATPPGRLVALALRDARLLAAVPYLAGWDACLAAAPAQAPALVAELCAFPGPALVATAAPWQPSGLARERPCFLFEFPVPGYTQRKALWEHYLDALSPAGGEGVAVLAGQFALTAGQIRDAVAIARDRAAQRGEAGGVQDEDLVAAARAQSSPGLSGLARKIRPRFRWEDIVLPADQLTLLGEIVATVRSRPQVLEEWGVGHKLASSSGVTMLFAGPPGTGKTMAAEVIAADLGLDLYKIDLSTIVSKYIGETEKNLERIFAEAQTSNAILFFDEADAIFGKRSEVKDAHDRYANIEISYLLQRMEAYDGVTILATNLRANLDEAFTRRLQFAVDFPFPEEEYRLRIWETLFPPGVPRGGDVNFGLLAQRFRLAGGNIRNIIVNAAYLAAADGKCVGMDHLMHGTRRELQKMGRLLNERDLVLDKGDRR